MFKNSKVKKLLAFSFISGGVLFCGTSVSATMRRPVTTTGGASSSTPSTRPRVRTIATGESQGLLSSGGGRNYGTFKISTTGRSSRIDPNRNPNDQGLGGSWSQYRHMLQEMRDEASDVQQQRLAQESDIKYGIFTTAGGEDFRVVVTEDNHEGMRVFYAGFNGEGGRVMPTGGGRFVPTLETEDVIRLQRDPNNKLKVVESIDPLGREKLIILLNEEGTLALQPLPGIIRDVRKGSDGRFHLGPQRDIQSLLDSGVPGVRESLNDIVKYAPTPIPSGEIIEVSSSVQSTRM